MVISYPIGGESGIGCGICAAFP